MRTPPPNVVSDSRAAGPGEWRKAAILASVFFCVTAVGMWHHEMWRDEWQGWMLARDSASLAELLSQLRVEGHLPGWYLGLFGLGRFVRDPAVMQVGTLLIATGAIYLLGRFAPFSWALKVLMAFGYFLAYEYAVFSRPYVLGVLALFTFCALFPIRRGRPLAVAAALVLLASTSLYGVIIAGAACGMLLLEASATPVRVTPPRLVTLGARIGLVGWGIGCVGAVVLAVTYPPDSLSIALGTGDLPRTSLWAIATTVSTVTQAYLPIPDVSAPHMWDTHIIPGDSRVGLGSMVGLALALLVIGGAILLRTPFVLFFFLVASGGLLLFSHLVFGGFLRHHGHLFLVLIAGMWLARLQPERWRAPPWMTRLAGRAVTGLLLVHVASAAILYVAEIRTPFSAAPAAAEFIREQGLADFPVAASPAPPASSIAGVLDRPIHYLALGSPGTFIRWDQYSRGFDRVVSVRLIRPFVEQHASDVLIILGAPFDGWDEDLEVEELARFEAGLEQRERFVLYRVGVRGS